MPHSTPLPPDAEHRLARLERLAELLDHSITVPGIHYKIGLDGLIGLIPGIGDTLTAGISAYLILEARQAGASNGTIARMIGNAAIDWAVGLVPLVGDLLDLDAALGDPDRDDNRAVIGEIASALDIPIQLGGGIRSMDDIEAAIDMGVYRVILGTAAVRNPDLVSEAIERFSNCRVVVGIDARDGEVRVDGWTEGSGVDVIDLALDMEQRGCRRFIYTDISRDGTLQGVNVGEGLKFSYGDGHVVVSLSLIDTAKTDSGRGCVRDAEGAAEAGRGGADFRRKLGAPRILEASSIAVYS